MMTTKTNTDILKYDDFDDISEEEVAIKEIGGKFYAYVDVHELHPIDTFIPKGICGGFRQKINRYFFCLKPSEYSYFVGVEDTDTHFRYMEFASETSLKNALVRFFDERRRISETKQKRQYVIDQLLK